MRPLLTSLWLAVAGLLPACGTERAARLEEGVSTEADVRRQFGEPVQSTERADGSKLLASPRQPEPARGLDQQRGRDRRRRQTGRTAAAADRGQLRQGAARHGPGCRGQAAGPPCARAARRHPAGRDRVALAGAARAAPDGFGLVYDADGRVPQANLAGDDRQTQPGG